MNKPVSMIQVAILIGIGCGISTAWLRSDIATLSPDLARVVQVDKEPDRAAPRPASQAQPTLFDAIRQVESGGFDGALGKHGECGPYQVTRDWWIDASEGLGWDTDATFNRYAFDRNTCEFLMRRYWDRYDATTDEQKARTHNGGPSMRGTDAYWAKVQEAMQ